MPTMYDSMGPLRFWFGDLNSSFLFGILISNDPLSKEEVILPLNP